MGRVRWRIRGGRSLIGRVRVGGAKNTAFKAMIAALLADGPSVLENVPDVEDVRVVARAIEALGGRAMRVAPTTWVIDPRSLAEAHVSADPLERTRASPLLMVPLMVRFGEASVPRPGGDRIGRRPLDRVLAGLEALGAHVQEGGERLLVRGTRLRGAHYRFPKNTHTGTEALLLAAVCARGETLLENAAQEPEVDDLIAFLNAMGARICRTDERTIRIEGVSQLHGARHRVMPDRNEAVTFACAALATRGEVEIEDVRPADVRAFLEVLEEMGAGSRLRGTTWRVWSRGPLRPVVIRTAPHPGFMTDWQPLIAPVLTQADGTSVIHETVFENRFHYARELQRMGARIEFFNPPLEDPETVYNFNLDDDRPEFFHAIRIFGPTPLRSARVSAADIRGGAALVIAALAAQGESVVEGIEHLERGYDRLDVALRSLGAEIERVEEETLQSDLAER
ncbi:MAG: UDP-N-acetylglucosamine 1-carboxyvinyltransferase [Blastocatellia bacterium]|nr:UDP-N-acetylglucosamine 1-carboxyvinyltransferase [Blastocatellia bacterium]MCS7157982.1 UDP-N-acetylglucosamine 1-carboxyvinyltransferase [Blastocatellia bacterium]MCX7752489.1 UDP-N-acetylglucosamine 1-carboxyvinyltransferase [Blastocatellia bacterium]MDW8167396.1 UDP-N-acetylglucosamine 1-carboxyvinyltransferase [Acidobacteriota bacterium]MDW8257426.1 UDP-N-acetylglucosamine 1-carboxyvinyltransferase [Acidobacteriota bacterium]